MQKACAKVLRHMSFQCVRNVRRGAGGRIPGWYLRIGLSYVRTSSWLRIPPNSVRLLNQCFVGNKLRALPTQEPTSYQSHCTLFTLQSP